MNTKQLLFCLPVCALVATACATARSTPAVSAPAPVSAANIPTLEQRPADVPQVQISTDAVRAQMAELLGDPEALASKAAGVDHEITSDLEILSYASDERVAYFVDIFSGRSREQTRSWLSRGTRFEPMVRTKLRDASLPEDLYYLAFIESGFNADAYSSAAAVGMWQFMAATAKGEGMRVDWWVDDRRDPVLATDGAVRHLSWLRRQFGSLFLAAAAYNGGSGLVSRGLTRHATALESAEGEGMFFALAETNYLNQETRDYVPKLIAAALVAKSANRLDITYDTLAPLVYDSVHVGPAVPLAAIARAAGVESEEVTSLNNHVLRGLTHPKESMWIRVPLGSAVGFRENFRAVPAADLVPYTRVQSRSGETFAAVARRVGLTSRQLSWYNERDGTTTRALPAGTTILVPSKSVVAAAKDVPNPAISIYGSSASRHVVKSGDTLGAIAVRYRTSVATLKRLNGLRSDTIRAGQSLRVR